MTAGRLQASGQRLRERNRNTNGSHLVDSPLGGTLERLLCDGMKLGHDIKYFSKSSSLSEEGASSLVKC